jgi:hypothetical protein
VWLRTLRYAENGCRGLRRRLEWPTDIADDKRSARLQKLDEECPYQVVLPRRQLMDDSAVTDFLLSYVGKFDLYVEDRCPA